MVRVVAFHRLGRFRDRGPENQRTGAAALTLVTAAIILCNCRYRGRTLDVLQSRDRLIDDSLSPLGWDRINLTGDYVWSDTAQLDKDGPMLLDISEPETVSPPLP